MHQMRGSFFGTGRRDDVFLAHHNGAVARVATVAPHFLEKAFPL
jgi:hypothetical protein